jgi:hypothetical protein
LDSFDQAFLDVLLEALYPRLADVARHENFYIFDAL